jgi:hypothetical protein
MFLAVCFHELWSTLMIPQWFVTHEPSLCTHSSLLRWELQYTRIVFCVSQTTEVGPESCFVSHKPLK